ncbi:VOC family protein [Pedobacter yulinensis]|uniref:VOC family protein n=1 Tax=Pedobacter yulinensis TaxID=2126353 RepID=A0A2T3HGW6_9SPHI|nr:VOC family protein [Pedobacter yulinensis]PST81680.1 VOC family protein [Pedobacter yulinensis]
MATINPYLNFNGKAEEAFKYYQSILGGELFIQKMKGAPGTETLSAAEQERVMHVALPVGNNVLMASDCLESMGHRATEGNNYYISLSPDSRDEADRIFQALAEGGTIEMPLEDMFWGDYFGSLKDRFGIQWMINYKNTDS